MKKRNKVSFNGPIDAQLECTYRARELDKGIQAALNTTGNTLRSFILVPV